MKTYALITGASSGIGLEFARIHASKGGHCILVARSESKLLELQQEWSDKYNVDIKIFAVDLTQPGACQKLYDWVKNEKLEVHILFNNAGFGSYGFFHKTPWQKQANMIDLNVKALTELTYLFLPELIQRRGGHILNNASVAAFLPGPLMAVYFATKAYVLHFSEAVAAEVQDTGVRVTAVCYGPVQSNFQQVSGMDTSRLIKGRTLPDSYTAALFGYQAMLKGKMVAIFGWDNKLMTFLLRLLPRKWVVQMALYVQKSK